jgi:hypothetical protein
MNNQFMEIITICMQRILDQKFIAGGYAVQAQDSLNDVIQYCDNKNLKQTLHGLCNSVIELIHSDIIAPNTKYTPEQCEQLINNFGGLLQVIIVRLEEETFDQQLYQKVLDIVNTLG